MTKPREKTREELTAEIEDSKKKIQQYENREKILRQKLSREERRERNHRLIVRGAVFESIVPEAKNMTDEEATALLRLAREIEAALPRELSGEQQLALVRAYVKDNFVDKGMCADFAIHDKGTGNPHVHIMLTLRPLKENGQWGAKCRKA